MPNPPRGRGRQSSARIPQKTKTVQTDSLLSKQIVMARLGVSDKTLRRMIREGRLKVVKFGKTSPLKFRQLDVARCLEAATLNALPSTAQLST